MLAALAGRAAVPLLQVYDVPVTNAGFDDGVHTPNNI